MFLLWFLIFLLCRLDWFLNFWSFGIFFSPRIRPYIFPANVFRLPMDGIDLHRTKMYRTVGHIFYRILWAGYRLPDDTSYTLSHRRRLHLKTTTLTVWYCVETVLRGRLSGMFGPVCDCSSLWCIRDGRFHAYRLFICLIDYFWLVGQCQMLGSAGFSLIAKFRARPWSFTLSSSS